MSSVLFHLQGQSHSQRLLDAIQSSWFSDPLFTPALFPASRSRKPISGFADLLCISEIPAQLQESDLLISVDSTEMPEFVLDLIRTSDHPLRSLVQPVRSSPTDLKCRLEEEIVLERHKFWINFKGTIDRVMSELKTRIRNATSTIEVVFAPRHLDQTSVRVPMPVQRHIRISQLRRRSYLCHGCPLRFRQAPVSDIVPLPFEPNCKVIRFSRSTSAIFKVNSSIVSITFPHKKRREISIASITFIHLRSNTIGEIFTEDKSYLISCHNAQNPLSKLPSVQTPLLKWKSNFNLLLSINRLSGRSFNDKICYPIFPTIIDFDGRAHRRKLDALELHEPRLPSEIRDLRQELMNAHVIAPELFCCPELITATLPYWASSGIEFVYRMRQALESNFASSILPNIIDQIWGVKSKGTCSHKPVFNSPFTNKKSDPSNHHGATVQNLEQSHITWAYAYDNWLHFVTFSGEYFHYSFSGLKVQQILNCPLSQDLSSIEFYHDKEKLHMFNKRTHVLSEVGSEINTGLTIAPRMLIINPKCMIYSPDALSIFSRPGGLICHSDGRITAMAASLVFQLLVIATAVGTVHFVNLPTGHTIASVDVADLVTAIEITESWGFVLALSKQTLNVFTVNGMLIRRQALTASIIHWALFSSAQGFDFVVFADSANTVGFFEAFYPDKFVGLLSVREVRTVGYDRTQSRLLAVTEMGEVHLIPWVPPVPPDPVIVDR
jgi:hypothetical protein